VKKGIDTVGVQRQYTGTAGRIENAQVGVYMVYAAGRGHGFLDRALYLPKSWTTDPERCRAAGVPDEVRFATKPALAREMIARALDAGTPAARVAGDEVYGNDPRLRADLHARRIGYVLAVAKDHRVTTAAGKHNAADLAAALPARLWARLSAGVGAKGHRVYDWALIDITETEPDTPGCHRLLLRRSIHTHAISSPDQGRRPPLDRCPRPWNPSKQARVSPVSTSTRSAAGPRGTAGPSSPCSRTPSWP
jgi:SRSO17 transposase